ncbi:MAG TPA: DUF2937 family protein [Burkholderiaceae bacterium]
MTGLIRGALDRLVLVAAILAGGCVPSFMAQYRQRLGGRLDQVIRDLVPFEQIAQRDFGGSLDALIQHHRDSVDHAFQLEGSAIQQMVETASRLREAVAALDTNVYGQFAWLVRHADLDLVQATWSAWRPSFDLSLDGLSFSIVAGLTLWVLFLMMWHGTAFSVRRFRRARVAA